MTSRRPANRKQQIRAAAGDLFLRRGFHNVSMADVAEEVGITPGALYHHYENKQDLLFQTVLEGIGAVDAMMADAPDLGRAVDSLVELSLGPRRVLGVWEREARALDEEQRGAVRDRQDGLARRLVPLLRADRPDLEDDAARILAWALLGVFGSRSRHRLQLPRRRHADLLRRLASVVAGFEFDGPAQGDGGTDGLEDPSTAGLALTRRDQLLAEAIRLFDERGYQAVTMADIGEAAGIVASGVYRHFPGKTDLIVTAMNRGRERVRAAAERALARAADPDEALRLLLESHVEVVVENPHLVGILAHERDQLPDTERAALRRIQADYLALWVQVLDRVVPDQAPTELKVVIHAVHNVVYLVARADHGSSRGALTASLDSLGRALLLDVWTQRVAPQNAADAPTRC